MKKIIRLLSLVLLILQVLPLAVSCTKNNGDAETTPDALETIEDGASGEGSGVKLVENGALKYTVIKYPAEPDEDTFNAIKRLRDSMKEYTGSAPQIKPDYSNAANPSDPNAYEILVGETNYAESKEVLSTIDYGDYAITSRGNKIVIAAYSGEDIARAITYVIVNMLKPKDDQGNRKLEITEYSYITKRYINKVDINGVDLKEFTISYGTAGVNDDYILAAAMSLRKVISEKSGYTLPIVKDTEEIKTSKRLYVGVDFSGKNGASKIDVLDAMSYSFKSINGDFYILGGGLLSIQFAVDKFYSTFFSARPADGKVSITDVESTFLSVTEAPRSAGTEFRVMTYNIMAQWEGWGGEYMPVAKRYEGFEAVMNVYDPDIVGLQEVSSQWSDKIYAEYGDEYAFVNRNTPDGKFVNLSTIIYRKDRFELIKSGLQYFSPQGPNHIRLVDWGIFKDKQTGKTFAFFNTHWDGRDQKHWEENVEIINTVMSQNPTVKYVFSTGDYNTNFDNPNYSKFMNGSSLFNSLDIARAAGTNTNSVGGCAPVGTDKQTVQTTGPIDHIFISNNMKVLLYETVIWNCVHHVSDHSPKYIDVILGE